MYPHGSYTPSTGQSAALPIGIVSDVRVYREGLAESLAHYSRLTVAWAAGDLETAVARAAEDRASAAVVDLAMHDCLLLIRAMRRVSSTLAIVAFASHDLDREIIACAEAGIRGLVSCDGSLDDLTVAVTRAVRGEMSCSPRAAAVLVQRVASLAADHPATAASCTEALTLREHTILELLDGGLSNKEIASRLHIQVATVKNHVHNVLEKMHVGSRSEAAAKHRAILPPRSLRALASSDSPADSIEI